MAAITPHLEQQNDPSEREEEKAYDRVRAKRRLTVLRGLGQASHDAAIDIDAANRAVQVAHSNLVATAWTRRAIEEELEGRTITVVVKGRELVLELDVPIAGPLWNPAGAGGIRRVAVLSWTKKMGCPSFSLPAGPPEFGGSCPGALGGQSIVPEPNLRKGAAMVQAVTGEQVNLADAVCQWCVAGDTVVVLRGDAAGPYLSRIQDLPRDRSFEVWSGLAWRETHLVERGSRPTIALHMSHQPQRPLRLTPDHKVLVAGVMVPAGELQPGDMLTADGLLETGEITLHAIDRAEVEVPVFDLVNVGPEQQFSADGIRLSNCYAEGGNYRYGSKQLAQVILYMWTRRAVADGSFVAALDWAIKHANFHLEATSTNKLGNYPAERRGKFFRLHDSGDFYSPEYLRAWKEIADRNPQIMFWAPSRYWAAGRGAEFVDAINGVPGNLVIRPSAFMVDSAAPRLGPGWAAGSTVFDLKAKPAGGPFHPQGPYNWDCQAYAVEKEAHTCRHAMAPDGKRGCRACWINPEFVVNYTKH